MSKASKAIFKEARRQGWKVKRTGGGHVKLVPPDPSRPVIHTGSTPSDHRAERNLLAMMRRAGFVWQGR